MRSVILSLAFILFTGMARAGSKSERQAAHWAFQPVRQVDPPAAGPQHPIDRFLRAKSSIAPAAPADRRTLIRRISFDLTGLPPSPARVAAFVADDRPDATVRLIDELLDSPRYGERWGRYWLDLARYADTAGENSDYPIPEAYRYRDYVIDAFNQDKPYDQFLHEQLAGDILAQNASGKRYEELVVATGFVSQAKRFGTHKLEDMHLIIEDTLQTLGQSVMGMTFSCARCHDHKYDPISMKEYYGLYSFFEHTAYPFPGGEEVKQPSGFVPVITPAVLSRQDEKWMSATATERKQLAEAVERARTSSPERAALTRIQQTITRVKQESSPGSDELAMRVEDELTQLEIQKGGAQKRLEARVEKAKDVLAALEAQRPSKRAPLAYAIKEGAPVQTRVHLLGNPKSPGEVVARSVPKILGGTDSFPIPEGTSGRLELAQWLTHPDHPLTARVMVNRIWQHHFGKPIVGTPSDFGLQGESPTHPDLLDWLARRFIEGEWSIKSMHRLMMSAQAYQLASQPVADDPENAFYTSFDRRRLDAEAIRDSLLAVSGNLDLNRPGPHPFPAKDQWKFTAHHQFKAVYPSKHRSVYLMVQRLHPHPYLALFDGANTSQSTAVRGNSTVASQALFMSNSPFVYEQARGFASSLIDQHSDPRVRIEQAYARAFARLPRADEIEQAEQYIQQYTALLVAEKVPEERLAPEAWASFARTLLAANEFVYVD